MYSTNTLVDIRTNTEFDEVHVHCCVDFNAILCGIPPEGPAADPSEETTCVVCADLEETDYCPKGLICGTEFID